MIPGTALLRLLSEVWSQRRTHHRPLLLEEGFPTYSPPAPILPTPLPENPSLEASPPVLQDGALGIHSASLWAMPELLCDAWSLPCP